MAVCRERGAKKTRYCFITNICTYRGRGRRNITTSGGMGGRKRWGKPSLNHKRGMEKADCCLGMEGGWAGTDKISCHSIINIGTNSGEEGESRLGMRGVKARKDKITCNVLPNWSLAYTLKDWFPYNRPNCPNRPDRFKKFASNLDDPGNYMEITGSPRLSQTHSHS